MLLVGSNAFGLVTPQLFAREPADIDLIGTFDETQAFIKTLGRKSSFPIEKGKKMLVLRQGYLPIEIEIAWPGTSAEMLLKSETCRWRTIGELDGHVGLTLWSNLYSEGLTRGILVPDLDVLYALKLSHRYLKDSPHFRKTMLDIQKMRKIGVIVPDELRDFLKFREKETYWYAHPKLNASKDEFFDEKFGVKYTYDHDSIHRCVAGSKPPAYTLFKKPGSEVMCDRSLFFACPEEERLRSVAEEAYVLALERSQVPHPGVWTPWRSFEFALMKVCTSITSGWWREYAYDHYDQVLSLYDDKYVERFWKGVNDGIVVPLKPVV